MKMKRNLPLIILLSSLVMGCTQHKTDMPRQGNGANLLI
ncbi:putative lipoprotein [Escherichia coli 7-233-03_S3_C2]|nr:putative lipoprotein [Escherichia coli 3-073-06_S4_C1]KDZ74624.1 putative lipoprotein [Escherichia coli 3-073-06_S4_C3]KEN23416.1 putative lipoprotein [Escherichia coli 7-233-03_S3_C2]